MWNNKKKGLTTVVNAFTNGTAPYSATVHRFNESRPPCPVWIDGCWVLLRFVCFFFCFFNQNPGEVFVSVAFPSQTLLAPPLMCRHQACSLHHGMTGMTLLQNFSRGIKMNPLDVPLNMPEGDAAGFGTRLQDSCYGPLIAFLSNRAMDIIKILKEDMSI